MLPISDDEVSRWRIELEQATDFRKEEFGTYLRNEEEGVTGAGENLNYFECGTHDKVRAMLNMSYVITKNIVPLLYPQNPKAISLPTRKQDARSAPIAAKLLNHYIDLLNLKETDQQNVFDSWVLGYGVSKIGYVTHFGADIPLNKKEEKKKLHEKVKDSIDKGLEELGIKQPKKEDADKIPFTGPEENIISESPYVRWVDPFNFLIDPRARSINDAWWVAETVTKTLHEIKQNPRFSSAKNDLVATPLEDSENKIPDTEIEKFTTAKLHNVHYKNAASPTGITELTLAVHGDQIKPLYHDHNVYRMPGGGWQYELLAFNKHNHRLYPVSDLTQVRPLLDRINDTVESVIEQVDKFVAKIVYNEKVTATGIHALKNGGIGACVETQGNIRDSVAVISMEQLKGDLMVLIDKLVDLVILVVGMTRAQLTGLSTAQTATGEQIGQGGSLNRRNDQEDSVIDYTNRQIRKLWSVIAQFVDLEQIQLLTGEAEYDPETGLPNFNWLEDIDEEMSNQLKHGIYRTNIEMTSLKRPNLEILRKQIENLVVVLSGEAITIGLMRQGKEFDVAEAIRKVLSMYPELIPDPNRLLRPVTQQAPLTPGAPHGGDRGGKAEAIRQSPPPNTADIVSAAAGERGQGVPLA